MIAARTDTPEVQAAIDKLRREDRAMLRPWILARYDVRGYAARGY
jgi:hypothetical protein